MKTSVAEAQQNVEASSADDKSDEGSEGSSDSEKREATSGGSKSTEDFEKLFFDSLVQGVREALGGTEQKQTSGDC